MRAALVALLLVGCGPKVTTTSPSFDEDLGRTGAAPPAATTAEAPRPIAPPGKGQRTGTIERARLVTILDAGPAQFLRQLEVAPHLVDGNRFLGWELVQLVDPKSALYDVDLLVGDVLLSINGKAIARPDQLQTVWDSLRQANEVTAQLWRGKTQLTLAFQIQPAL